MEADSVIVEPGSPADVRVLMSHREYLWRETGSWKPKDLAVAVNAYEKWLEAAISEGRVIPFLGKIGKVIAGTGSIWIRDIRPAPARSKLSEAVLIGMYTMPEFRRMKVASAILEKVISWSRSNGFDELVLHSSEQGKSLYIKYGFSATSELRLPLV